MRKGRGEIVAIKDLFAKYKKTLQAPQKTVELEAIKIIGEVVGVSLKESQISYAVSTRSLYIKASGMLKQEIKLQERELLKLLAQALGQKNAPQVIL